MPLCVSCASCTGTEASLSAWLESELGRLGVSRWAARKLVERQAIYLLLDGLDELEPTVADHLVSCLSETELGYVLTARSLTAAATATLTARLTADLVAHLQLPASGAYLGYVQHCNRGRESVSGRTLLAEIRGVPTGTLAQTTRLPFAGGLLQVAVLAEETSRPLLRFVGEPASVTTIDAAAETLLSVFCQACLARGRRLPRRERIPMLWSSSDQITRWTAGLAKRLATNPHPSAGGSFLPQNYWLLGRPRLTRLLDLLLTLAFWAPVLVVLAWNPLGLAVRARAGAALVALLLIGVSVAASSRRPHPAQISLGRLLQRRGRRGLAATAATSAAVFAATSIAGSPLRQSSAYVLTLTLVLGVGLSTEVREDVNMSVIAACNVGILVPFYLLLARTSISGQVAGSGQAIIVAMGGAALCMVASVKIGIVVSGLRGGGRPDAVRPGRQHPLRAIRQDLYTGVAAGLLAALGTFVAATQPGPLRQAAVPSLYLAAAAALAAGPGLVSTSWRRATAASAASVGMLPVQWRGLLRWALRTGYMRPRGASVEFRHERQRVWLLRQ